MKHLVTSARALLAPAALCALLALAGCSASAAESNAIGVAGSGAPSLAVTNETGKDIETFALRRGDEPEFGEPLQQASPLADGADAVLYGPTDETAALDLQFTTTDGAIYRLRALKFADMQDTALKLSGNGTTCYAEYVDAASGKPASVLESEQMVKEKTGDAETANAEVKAAKKKAKAAEKARKQAEEERDAAVKERKAAEKEAERLEAEARDAAAAIAAAAGAGADITTQSSKSAGSTKSSVSSSSSSKKNTSSSTSSSSSSKKKSSSSSSSSKKSSSSKSNASSKSSKSSGTSSSSGSSSSSDDEEDNRCIEL